MPKFKLAIPHAMSHEDARERVRSYTEKAREFYGDQASDLQHDWDGDRLGFGFKTFGMKIEGALTVEPNQVVVEGDLPFAAAMFKGRIESGIREQLERILR